MGISIAIVHMPAGADHEAHERFFQEFLPGIQTAHTPDGQVVLLQGLWVQTGAIDWEVKVCMAVRAAKRRFGLDRQIEINTGLLAVRLTE